MRIKDKGVDDPRKALSYTHARHLHPDKVRCSEAGDEGHQPWHTDPWGNPTACAQCREFAKANT